MKKKVVAAMMSVALVVAVGIGGTLAYLSAQSEPVTNTFALGTGYIDDGDHEGIYLDEEDVDNSSEGTRDTENEYDNMIPATSYVKDPLVHMVGGSIESYVFVYVDGLQELDAEHIHVYHGTKDNMTQGINPDLFTPVQVNEYGDGIYLYKGGLYPVEDAQYVVDVSDETNGADCQLGKVFDFVMMDGDVSSDDFGRIDLTGDAITVQAAAVQYAPEQMDSYQDAVNELPAGWFAR